MQCRPLFRSRSFNWPLSIYFAKRRFLFGFTIRTGQQFKLLIAAASDATQEDALKELSRKHLVSRQAKRKRLSCNMLLHIYLVRSKGNSFSIRRQVY